MCCADEGDSGDHFRDFVKGQDQDLDGFEDMVTQNDGDGKDEEGDDKDEADLAPETDADLANDEARQHA